MVQRKRFRETAEPKELLSSAVCTEFILLEFITVSVISVEDCQIIYAKAPRCSKMWESDIQRQVLSQKKSVTQKRIWDSWLQALNGKRLGSWPSHSSPCM